MGLKAPYEKLCAEPIWSAIELSRIMDLPSGCSTTLNKVCGFDHYWKCCFPTKMRTVTIVYEKYFKNPFMAFQKCRNNVSMQFNCQYIHMEINGESQKQWKTEVYVVNLSYVFWCDYIQICTKTTELYKYAISNSILP